MTTTGAMTRGRIAVIVAVLCFSCAVCAAEKCHPSDVQYDGLYVCWDGDGIAAFEDLSVTDNPPTNFTQAIFSGPNEGSWSYVRLERALHALGWNFEGGTGTFTKGWSGDPDDVTTTTSLDRGNITYIIDGSFESPIICNIVRSQTPWWTADCMATSVDDFDITIEFVLEEDDPCAVNTIYVSNRANSGKGLPYFVGGGECVRVDDDFIDAPLKPTNEDGDLNGAGLDSVCDAGYTLVHEEGNGVEGFFLSEDVLEDNCAQFCVPDFVLGMLSDEDQPVLPGSCEDAGYLEHVAQATTRLIPGSPLTTVVDVYDRGDGR